MIDELLALKLSCGAVQYRTVNESEHSNDMGLRARPHYEYLEIVYAKKKEAFLFPLDGPASATIIDFTICFVVGARQ